jgi:hypothetical protein
MAQGLLKYVGVGSTPEELTGAVTPSLATGA